MFNFNIAKDNTIVDTVEFRSNRTLEIFESGHSLYNYEGTVYYLFNTKQEAMLFIDGSDQSIPHAIQEPIYENGQELDNEEWEIKNSFKLKVNTIKGLS